MSFKGCALRKGSGDETATVCGQQRQRVQVFDELRQFGQRVRPEQDLLRVQEESNCGQACSRRRKETEIGLS